MNIMGIILEDAKAKANAVAALLASSVAMVEANLSIDLTIELLFSEREFFDFLFNTEDCKLFLASAEESPTAVAQGNELWQKQQLLLCLS